MEQFTFDFKNGHVIVKFEDANYGKITVELPLIAIAEKAAAATDNTLDDKFVAMVKEAIS